MSETAPDTPVCSLGAEACPLREELATLKKEMEILHSQVQTDDLTGLYNKRHLTASLEREVERTRRSLQATTFILLDIDHFKAFNDNYGHIAGDKVLQHIGDILRKTVRKIDIPCRYGGEEFAIILPSTPILTGKQVAERVRLAIEESSLDFEGQSLKVTASLGVESFLPNSADHIEEFIALTDKQLYRAKESGRNQVCHAVHSSANEARVSDDEKDALFNLLDDDNEQST